MAYQAPAQKDEVFTNLKPKFRFNIIQHDIIVNKPQMHSCNDSDFDFGLQEEFIKKATVLNIHTNSSDKSPKVNYCRVCANIVSASCLTLLSDSKDGISFIDKIKFCFSEKVQVHLHDGLPQEICNSCIVQLNACNNTLESIIKANLKLEKLFKLKRLPVITVKDNSILIYKEPNSSVKERDANPQVKQKELNLPIKVRVLNLPVTQMISTPSVTQKVPNSSPTQRLSNPPVTQNVDNLLVRLTLPKQHVTQNILDPPLTLRLSNPPSKQREANPTEKEMEPKPPVKQTEPASVVKVTEPIFPVIEIEPTSPVNETDPNQFEDEIESNSSMQDIEPSSPVQDVELKTSMIVEPTSGKLSAQPIQQKSDQLENGDNEGFNNNTLKTSVKTKYQCMSCQCVFETKGKVVQHFISTHKMPAQRRILCKVINTEENESDTKHSGRVSPAPNVTEEKSGSNDKAIFGISYHCLLCSLVFQRENSFAKHTLTRHQALGKRKFACKIVKKKISENGNICTECNTFFSNKKLYSRHMQRHGLYKCGECNLSFDRMYKLKMHKRTHKPQQSFLRAVTHKDNTESELVQEDHDYFKPRKFRCTTCFEIYDSRFLVRQHQLVHKSRLCNQCGKIFASNYLQAHIKTHLDQRPFSCNICSKSFKTKNSLRKHRNTHDNDRNFICQHCGKTFRTIEVLRQHVQAHSSVKRHACDICGFTFHRRATMVKHRRIHIRSLNAAKIPAAAIADRASVDARGRKAARQSRARSRRRMIQQRRILIRPLSHSDTSPKLTSKALSPPDQ